ncbi:TNT domain-containing protein [Amycolatopsis suaedae]|uniref:DUF4237 domain-containing protein n=1 Tax=Amycolatopsis suaedae TaxID=2510978 RepID=A0A4Q7JD08_9PSEU|nr:TNT domain-containing protein [Amycolatopsis suaedae]RZQ65018.1 DUF4237 domain-containing protein [Amycolatopsis suaedae]
MRYRIDAAERPDALYTVWNGQVFRAQRSTADGTVLLTTLPGEEAPADFDREVDGAKAKVVPEAEAPSTFSVQTHCRYAEDIYRVAPQNGGDTLTLRWTGTDEASARDLGLTDFTVRADPDEIEAIWQERHDFLAADTAGPPQPGGTEPSTLLRAIGRTILKVLPEGWQRVGAQLRQVGGYAELEVRAVADDLIVSLSPPAQLGQLFTLLRSAMYQPGAGTWFQGTFTLDSNSNFDFDYDLDAEPNWRLAPGEAGRPGAKVYAAELERFPRDRGKVPGWLAARAGQPLGIAFVQAAVVDAHNEGEKPVVNRPPVPPDEVRRVLDYLYRSPVALARPGTLPDIFAPNGRPDVPDAFHTDGAWIWPAAVPHYLRKYGVPPQPELIDHIRANQHRPPFVPEQVRATAEADVAGRPRPPQEPHEVDAQTKADREPSPTLRATEVLTVLRRRLAELGVHESAYAIGDQPLDTGWRLAREGSSWGVARYAGGHEDEQPVRFEHVADAAQYLLGALTLFPSRGAGPADQQENPADWPILPMRGEPPLNFFTAKRLVVLPAGATVQRFGNEGGNLVHTPSATFPETSLAFDRERERHSYRVVRPLRVLTGVTVPWGTQPGGAVAYLLPRAVGQHVEAGALERL